MTATSEATQTLYRKKKISAQRLANDINSKVYVVYQPGRYGNADGFHIVTHKDFMNGTFVLRHNQKLWKILKPENKPVDTKGVAHAMHQSRM